MTRTVTLSTIRVKTMNDDIIVTLDNNPALEAKIASLEERNRNLDYEVAQWKHRCIGYENLLMRIYRET